MLAKRRNISIYLLVLFLVSIVGSMPVTALGAEKPLLVAFGDVSSSDPNALYIKYVVARGLMAGFPDGGYHPNEGLTRAQAAAVLVRTAGLDAQGGGGTVFKDVPSSHWAAGSIIAASNGGYIKGMSADIFDPEARLTRAQGISLFMRLSKQGDSGAALPALSDLNSDHWAARQVAMALDAGMVNLTSDKKGFNPNGDFTRGDLARMLALLLTKDPGLSQGELTAVLIIKQGEVKVQGAGADKAQVVSGNKNITVGDCVTTGQNGEAELNLPDGSGLLLKPNTVLTLKDSRGRNYIKKDGSPGTGVEYLEVELSQGRIFGALASIHNKSLKLSMLACLSPHFDLLAVNEVPWYKTAETKKVKVKVDMPWGVSAIRGSFWSNLVDDRQNSTSLLEGDVIITAAGASQTLAAGQITAIIGAGQAPTPTATMTADESKVWSEEKGWTEQRNSAIEQNREMTRAAVVQTVAPTPTPVPIPAMTTASGSEVTLSQIADVLTKSYPSMKLVSTKNSVILYGGTAQTAAVMAVSESEDCFIITPIPGDISYLEPILILAYPTQYGWIMEKAKAAYALPDPVLPELQEKRLDGRFVWFASIGGNSQLYIGKQGVDIPAYIMQFNSLIQ